MVVKLLEEPGFPATCRVKSEGVKIVAKRLEEPGFPAMHNSTIWLTSELTVAQHAQCQSASVTTSGLSVIPTRHHYSGPSILQPSILRPPLIIRPLDLVPKDNFLC